MPAPKTSPRPKADPRKAVASPQSVKPTVQEDKAKNALATQAKPTTTGGAPTAPAGPVVIPNPPTKPRAPDNPTTPAPTAPNNPSLPVYKVEAERGSKRPDFTLIDALNEPTAKREAQKYKGGVLASVYKLPVDGTKTAKTLQQFNGARGQRLTLGA